MTDMETTTDTGATTDTVMVTLPMMVAGMLNKWSIHSKIWKQKQKGPLVHP